MKAYLFFITLLLPIFGFTESVVLMEDGDAYFEATLFDKAIPLYKKILSQNEPESKDKVWLKLAQSFFLNGNYQEAQKELTDMQAAQKLPVEGLYLMGLTYTKLHQEEKAINAYVRFLALDRKESKSYIDHVYFELASAYFRLNKLSEAREQFEAVCRYSNKNYYCFVSQLYLAQITILEGYYLKAERMIQLLAKQIPQDDRLLYAIAFLQGEIAFHQKDYAKAIQHIASSIPQSNPEKAEWYSDALYLQGTSYLREAEKTSSSEFMKSALDRFQQLATFYPSDEAYLALGRALMVKAKTLGDQSAYSELETLLSDHAKFQSKESLQYAFLLRAEASSVYTDRKKFFHQLTQDHNASSALYAKAWYLRGINELQEGQRKQASGAIQEAKCHFDQASTSLEKAFELLYPKDKSYAAQALKGRIQNACCQSTKESYIQALSLISQLLNVYRTELFTKLDEPDEIYFLQGLAASHLAEDDEEKTYFAIAENSLRHCIETYRQGRFQEEARMLLGTLYYGQKNYQYSANSYLALTRSNPPSRFAGEAWYWAANCLEANSGDPQQVQSYRKMIFEQHPESPFAPEAYFRYYSAKDYLQGTLYALEHLRTFESKFPHSPYLLHAYYLLGLDSWDKAQISGEGPQKTLQAFDKVEEEFLYLLAQNQIPESKLPHFSLIRYRALLEKASILMQQPESGESAVDILLRIQNELTNPQNGMNRALANQTGYDYLFEESGFMLMKCRIKNGKALEADQLLDQMLEKYQSAKITRGYYLSRTWYEKGQLIAANDNEPQSALECFNNAEEASKGKILSTDELLDLWIQQSLCYQALQKHDEAMLILSKVINYDAASSLRLRAMFLRAEIYEQQGRYELARKQLEAIAKKGGEWASKAKTKLEEYYVYE